MFGKVVLWLLAFLVFISFNFGNPDGELFGNTDGRLPDPIVKTYHKADSLYRLTRSTQLTDSMALAGFEQVIAEIGSQKGIADKDQLLCRSYLQKGVLLDVKGDYAGATQAYCKTLSIPGATDSLLFVASVYAGTAYYNLNNFDSASYMLLRAEARCDPYQGTADGVRLYNTLGVLYYDNGNYRQGKNYFNHALEIVQGRKPFDTIAAVSLETNIATSFYRLGLYDESLSLYHKILNYRLGTGYIYMNMGRTYAALERYREALACFKKVDVVRVPGVLNEMAAAYLQLHRPDSCALFLNRLRSGSPVLSAVRTSGGAVRRGGKTSAALKPNALDIGVNEMYRADLLAEEQQYRGALACLQRSIILFSGNFRDTSIFSNPSGFTGSFAYYTLYDALYKKAMVFERLYREQAGQEYLSGAHEAYRAALAMLRYIEKSYDTDDAKLFLKKKSGQVGAAALSVCLELYRLHPGDHYLEEAFQISERNRASVISAGLKQGGFRNPQGVEDRSIQKERNIKYNIARLDIKSDETRDGKEFEALAREKAGYEIELSHLQKELEQNDAYYKLKYEDSSPGISELQGHLGPGQALVSLYIAGEALHIFTVTRSAFAYARVDPIDRLQKDAGDWLHLLQTAESGKKFQGREIGGRLYRSLVKPIQELIPQEKEWIIIPDGLFCYLPFESLPAEGGNGTAGESSGNPAERGSSGQTGNPAAEKADAKTLLETTIISYRFSSRFIVTPPAADQGSPSAYRVLGFAPFAGRGGSFDQAGPALRRLPASGEEIGGLPGIGYMDSMATKEKFLQEMNKYPVIHLATHAFSSTDNTAESFIAFYPEKRSRAADCLFLEELYGLNMSSTKLVIISACETGQGELVSDEGVISLARAFAYAGCGSTICSLWQADDRSTAAILGRFHIYLQRWYTKGKALQQAKLDYLHSDALNKSPAYWAHLVLIGNEDPVCAAGHPFLWMMVLSIAIILLGYWVKRMTRSGSNRRRK